jgi:ABC-type sugar transport system ATPase subunit
MTVDGADPLRDGSPLPDRDAILRVEHLTMRFGGLVAVNDLSFGAHAGAITALIGPNGAGKTTVFNCVTGFYKPTAGRMALRHGAGEVWKEIDGLTASPARELRRPDGRLFLLERMPDFLVAQKARVARTFQNIRLFGGMTVLENLLVAQHNALMRASGYTVLGARRRRPSTRRGRGSTRSRFCRAPTTRRATFPMARSGGSRSLARCAPTPCCSASTSRRPASTRAKAANSTTSSSRSASDTAPRSF